MAVSAQFTAWWAHASTLGEFRGCSKAAAYAAWLGGAKYENGSEIITLPKVTIVKEETEPEVVETPAPEVVKVATPSKRRYRKKKLPEVTEVPQAS